MPPSIQEPPTDPPRPTARLRSTAAAVQRYTPTLLPPGPQLDLPASSSGDPDDARSHHPPPTGHRPGNLYSDSFLALLSHRLARHPTARDANRFHRLLHHDPIFPQFEAAHRTAHGDCCLLSHSGIPVRCSQAARLEGLRQTIASTRTDRAVKSSPSDQTPLGASSSSVLAFKRVRYPPRRAPHFRFR